MLNSPAACLAAPVIARAERSGWAAVPGQGEEEEEEGTGVCRAAQARAGREGGSRVRLLQVRAPAPTCLQTRLPPRCRG